MNPQNSTEREGGTMNEVAKVLHDGLDRIRAKGLAKHALCDPETGAVCSRGALIDATPQGTHWGRNWTPAEHIADRLLSDVAGEQYPDRIRDDRRCIVDFNNHDDTTQDDVELVFEKAIVKSYELVA